MRTCFRSILVIIALVCWLISPASQPISMASLLPQSTSDRPGDVQRQLDTINAELKLIRTRLKALEDGVAPAPHPEPEPPPSPVPPSPAPSPFTGWPADWPPLAKTTSLARVVSGVNQTLTGTTGRLWDGRGIDVVVRNCDWTGGNGGVVCNWGTSGPFLIENVTVRNPDEYGIWFEGTDLIVRSSAFHGSRRQHPIRFGWLERGLLDGVAVTATDKGGLWLMHGSHVLIQRLTSKGIVGIGPNEHYTVDGRSTLNDKLQHVIIANSDIENLTGHCVQISSGTFDARLHGLRLTVGSHKAVKIGQRKDTQNNVLRPPPRDLDNISIEDSVVRVGVNGAWRPLTLSDLDIDPKFANKNITVTP